MENFTRRNEHVWRVSPEVESELKCISSFQFPRQDFKSRLCHNILTKKELERFSSFNNWRTSMEKRADVFDVEISEVQNMTCSKCKLPIVNRKLHLPLSRSRNCLTDLRERTTVVLHFSEDRGPRLWHPTCFHCSICHLQLVDLVFYPLKWSQLCCSRHHAETFMPRCHECDELIFTDEFITIDNKRYHKHHLDIGRSYQKLQSERYTEKVYVNGVMTDDVDHQLRQAQSFLVSSRRGKSTTDLKNLETYRPIREKRCRSKSEIASNEYLNSTNYPELIKEATNKSSTYETKHSNTGTQNSASYEHETNSTKLVASISSPNLNSTFIISAADNTLKTISTTNQRSDSHISAASYLPIMSINQSLYRTTTESKSTGRFFPPPTLDYSSQVICQDSNDKTTVSDCSNEIPEAKTPYSETNSNLATLEDTIPLETTDPSSQGYNSAERSTTSTSSADRSMDRDSMFSRSLPSETRSLTSTPSSDYQPSYLEPVSMHYLSRTAMRSKYGSVVRRLTYT